MTATTTSTDSLHSRRLPMAGIFLAALLAAAPACAEPAKLVVRLTGIGDGGGQLRVSLYREPETFRKEDRALHVATLPAASGNAEVAFDGLEPGRYAVMAYHDANGDKHLNLRLGMFPTEGYGLSNNPKAIGPPKFADSAFDVAPPAKSVNISIYY